MGHKKSDLTEITFYEHFSSHKQLPPSSVITTKQNFPEASSAVPTCVSHMARYI